MLAEFAIGNFLSFRDTQTVSFSATSLKDTKENIYSPDEGTARLLKSISVYGSNSAGKSNLLKAFNFFKYWIHNSLMKATGCRKYLFNLTYCRKDSKIKVHFLKLYFIMTR
jgi:AAA15 family ATPase/GTPase